MDVPLGIQVVFLSRLAGSNQSSFTMRGEALVQTKPVAIAQFGCAEGASSGGLKFLTVGSTPQSRDAGELTPFGVTFKVPATIL